MRRFTDLLRALDESNKTNDKVAALVSYFEFAPPVDAAWAVYFLRGERPKRLLGAARLREWAREASGQPEWMFDECYQVVGDLAETVALLVPPGPGSDEPLSDWIENRLLPLGELDEGAQRTEMLAAWGELDERQIFAWNKLITGALRVGVSRRLVVRALERATGVEAATLEHRLMGAWAPSEAAFRALVAPDGDDAEVSRPYPFLLAHPLAVEPAELGELADWQVEWKWDGIRAQIVRRGGETFVWTRGEELVTERYPEIRAAATGLPDGTVLDGELLAWRGDHPLPFARLQRRIGRKKLTAKILGEIPVRFLAYDLMERSGKDARSESLERRRQLLVELLERVGAEALAPSPVVAAEDWSALAALRESSRERHAEGFMIKRLDSAYEVGRPRGVWWKWKVDPFSVDAVLIYAQRGHGKRASLYTDYTFGVWDGEALVPFAKAYTGLTNDEIREVDRYVRQNVLERFGPVRSVEPRLVFEVAFEGIQRSTRHKSGVAVRFPRIARWHRDKRPEDADTLDTVRELLAEE